jgi:hypothetical protein
MAFADFLYRFSSVFALCFAFIAVILRCIVFKDNLGWIRALDMAGAFFGVGLIQIMMNGTPPGCAIAQRPGT